MNLIAATRAEGGLVNVGTDKMLILKVAEAEGPVNVRDPSRNLLIMPHSLNISTSIRRVTN